MLLNTRLEISISFKRDENIFIHSLATTPEVLINVLRISEGHHLSN
jgi:hypothetical protein